MPLPSVSGLVSAVVGGGRGDKTKHDDEGVWQDRDIRFDTSLAQLAIRAGEFQIDSINSVEDTKGNNGEKGSLAITNLRLIWICHRNSRINLSIGYNAVLSINIRTANSRLRGNTQALYVMTKYNNARFEFVFTNLVRQSPRLFTTVQTVYRAYDTSRLYRDLKLRGAIIKNKGLIMLPNEQLYNKLGGVWNLSSDQGNLGTFFISNVRVVWHANQAENFNVSIPYLQMAAVRVRDSKFGPALVIECQQRCGGYILGFRVDPAEQLAAVFQEIQSLHRVFATTPVFGVDFTTEEKSAPLEQLTVSRTQDDVEIVDTEEQSTGDSYASYLAEGHTRRENRKIILSPELGLAMEELPEGYTVQSLWQVV